MDGSDLGWAPYFGDILGDPRVVKGDGCWLWTGTRTGKGYGHVYVGSYRYELVHRLAYIEAVGPIPPGLVIDHLCHNRDKSCRGPRCQHRRCVRPDHLEAVTNGMNIRRGRNEGRLEAAERKRARLACPRGHLWTDANTYTRPDGRRYCRTCVALNIARRAA